MDEQQSQNHPHATLAPALFESQGCAEVGVEALSTCRYVALHRGRDGVWCYALLGCQRCLLVGKLERKFLADCSTFEVVEACVFPWFKAVTNRLARPHESSLTFSLISEESDEDLVPLRVIGCVVVTQEDSWDRAEDHELERDEVLAHFQVSGADLERDADRTAVVGTVRERTCIDLRDDQFDEAWALALLVTYLVDVAGEEFPAIEVAATEPLAERPLPVAREPRECLLTRAMLREIVPVTDMTLWRWLRRGTFPQPIKFAGRNYWRDSEVREWLRGQSTLRTRLGSGRGWPAA